MVIVRGLSVESIVTVALQSRPAKVPTPPLPPSTATPKRAAEAKLAQVTEDSPIIAAFASSKAAPDSVDTRASSSDCVCRSALEVVLELTSLVLFLQAVNKRPESVVANKRRWRFFVFIKMI